MGQAAANGAASDDVMALDTRLGGGVDAAGAARRLLTGLLSDETAGDTLDDALLLTTELITNAVLHGSAGETESIELRVASGPETVRVSVTDPGGETRPRTRALDTSLPGGMGLFLVDRISSDWGVVHPRSGGTQVWFELER